MFTSPEAVECAVVTVSQYAVVSVTRVLVCSYLLLHLYGHVHGLMSACCLNIKHRVMTS